MRYLFPTGKGYQRKWLGQDVLSGVVIAAVSIPISMGYAQIAGLPAVYGLYGSLLPVILFALLSTSPQFIFGVDAAPAAMIGGVLGGMGIAMGSAEAERVVPVLTFYVGIWLLLFALLRAGRVLRFVSTSVMGGFISGICCTIILMQLPKLMGGTAGTGELPELVRHLAGVQVHPLSLGLGAAALVILLAAKRLRPKFPMAIVVMGLGALAAVLFDLPGHGVACLGAVEPGLPALHLPDWSAVGLAEGLGSSLPVAVVIMAETLLAESSFAMRDGYEIRDSQELLAFAAANLGAGMVGCCPVNGSVSRSSMNVQYRGKTQAVSLVAAALMVGVLLWGSGLIRLLPVPVLTAIVISALLGAVELDMAHRLLRADRKELAIFLAAFLGVLVLGTIYGVVIGVLLSFVDVIRRASQPSRELLGVISGQPGFYPLGRMSQAHPLEGVALYRFSGGLFFANIDRFQKDVENCVKPGIRAVIVDASGIVSVDLTSAERLVLLYRRLEDQGVRLYLTEHIGQVNDELRRFGAGELIEEGAVRRTLYAALEDCGAAEGEVKQWIPEEMRHAVPELLRQTQELEWAYGEEAQSKLDAMTGQVLQTLKETKPEQREQELESLLERGRWQGVIDRDAVLQHLEEHLAELSRLLERSEDAVLLELEQERERVTEALRRQHPEIASYLAAHREELEQRFQRKYPEAARHIHELRQRLHQPTEDEAKEQR